MSLTNLGIGFAGSDWTAYTPTMVGFGTPSSVKFYYRRNGDSIDIKGTFVTGTPTATTVQISMPPNLAIDFTKVSNAGGQAVGQLARNAAASPYFVTLSSTDTANLYVSVSSSLSNASGTAFGSGEFETLTAYSIPVAGYSSNISIGMSSTYRISSYLANGTRVTATPTALGQWRAQLRNSSARTFTDGAPADLPSSSNGIRIYQGNAWGTADTSPTRYEIFVGKNKRVSFEWYANSGMTGYLDPKPFAVGSNADYGYAASYDPTTGLVVVVRANPTGASSTSHQMGLVTDGGPAATAPYFDIIVSENALAVGIAAPRSEVILSNDAGAGSTNTKVRNFSSVSNTGTAATGTLDAVNGAYVTINEDGVYGFQWDAVRFTATDTVQITRNSSIYLNPADTSKVLTQIDITAANLHYSPSGTRILRAGDVIRVLTFTSSLTSGNPTYHKLVVTKVSN